MKKSASITILLFLLMFPAFLAAQDASGYKMPPAAIAAIAEADPTPSVSFNPDQSVMAVLIRPGMPGIDELAEPELRIAGMRINPANNGRSRSSYSKSIAFKSAATGTETAVTGLPANARIVGLRWSPDGKRVAFNLSFADRIEIWGADVATGRAKMLTPRSLNGVASSGCNFLADSENLVCLLVTEDRGMAPVRPDVPTGPIIQENIGKTAPSRTYQDLLENRHDERLFEYYMTSEPVVLSWSGQTRALGEPGLYSSVSASPDGKYFLTFETHRPFSYLVPAGRFPETIQIRDAAGKTVRQLADLPLMESIPIGSGSTSPGVRSVQWRNDAAATVVWVEALDGGDPNIEVPFRDEIFMLAAPFTGDPVSLARTEQRYSGINWAHSTMALVWDSWNRTRSRRAWVIDPSKPGSTGRLLFDLNTEDRYADPGRPMTVTGPFGESVVRMDNSGTFIYLSGSGASEEGDRPFVDRMHIETGEKSRIWQSEAPFYEVAIDWLGDGETKLVTRRESVDVPPNYFVRNLTTGDLNALTDFAHPYPQLSGVQKELIRYERADGVGLTAELFLPAGYSKDDGPLPTFLWAYPREFKDADAAGQTSGSPYRFSWVSGGSPLFWVTQGYAVLNNASMPIIGVGDEEPNDTFIEQLILNAEAAIVEGTRRGVVDPDRVAVGGHSYGAFMTANLLAHSDLFRAGIARSGAYNRTLTPFGFQSEERTFWESPDVYFEMSPFMHAQKVNEPLLLIHGEADNNSGTFPIQSERYYNAIKGHGGTARLVMLPYESHGYQARESVLHTLWEMDSWLDTWVKKAPPRDEEMKVRPTQG